jgi:DNA-3-methyladenine glycosylase II
VEKTKLVNIDYSIKKLKEIDPDLMRLLNAFKIDDLLPEQNYFKSLTRSIIYQQLTGASAKAIHDRFISIYDKDIYPTPKQVLSTNLDILQSVGLSHFKAKYIKSIATAFIEDPIRYKTLDKKGDEDIINILTEIKGIGLWTAQMFLMFTLNRPDVFPATDLALKKGFQHYFELDDLPKENEMLKRSQKWRPHRTTVSLFFWRILEGPFEW